MLSRKEFVSICTLAIIKTRNTITIGNQVSGFQRYHAEIKEHDYVEQGRAFCKKIDEQIGYNLFVQHDFVEHTGLGHCHEMSEYLSVELLTQFKQLGVEARIRVVSSREFDHVYLNIRVHLQGERESSLWEIDAWNPRIIDVSMRPDGSIKNDDLLEYGDCPKLLIAVSPDEVAVIPKYNFDSFPKPSAGVSGGGATPPREIRRKHEHIHGDYSLDEAYASKRLDPNGRLHYPQQVSFWQKEVKKELDSYHQLHCPAHFKQ